MYGIHERQSGRGENWTETECPSDRTNRTLILRWGKLSVTALGEFDLEKGK